MQKDLEAMDARSLARGGAVAVVIATIVLLVAILPAEYGIDPTGIGKAVGFTRLSDAPAGVAVQQGTEDAVYAFDAEWRLVRTTIAQRSGSAEPGSSEAIVVPLNITNLTTVTARLEWTDDDKVDGATTAPDRFDLRIVAPDRRDSGYMTGENAPGGQGNVTAQVAWRSVPYPETEGTGRIVIPVEAPDRSGVGDWTFHVRLLRAGGTAGAGDEDPGNTWRLVVEAESFSLQVRKSEGGGDRVSLTLSAGSALEYKFRMDEGATLDYAWTSTAPLYWDLHAEPTGAAADDTTSFQTGTSGGDVGVHTAPFAGRHGWFWHNQGDQTLTIVLETRGDYEIIGVA